MESCLRACWEAAADGSAEYVIRATGWWSPDGVLWYDGWDFALLEGDDALCQIRLSGGPRDGQVVSPASQRIQSSAMPQRG